ncbi:MAG: type II toxin-antitoxin system VapC family toxin [Dehalococcoidia bacterium]
MTVDSPLFLDTNILIYATDPSSPWYDATLSALQTARNTGTEMVIGPQILREFVSSPTRGSATGQSSPMPRILATAGVFRRAFTLVEENSDVVDALTMLLAQVPTGGKQVHDANIVATMVAHGIRRLLTNNERHFNRFSAWITVVPLTQPT